MKLDPKLKGGLAWAGLVVILAVPSADILFGKSDGSPSTAITADTRQLKVPALKADPIETASIDSKDPVDAYVGKGKKLPDYISDGDAAAVQQPAVLKPVTPAKAAQPAEVASLTPAEDKPPMPLPRSARPKWTNFAATPAAPADEKPLILDEKEVASVKQPVEPFPLSDDAPAADPVDEQAVVSGDQLEEWDSGSLADYLERKGLLSDGSPAGPQASDNYDSDGFFLDEGPNAKRRPAPQEDFFLF